VLAVALSEWYKNKPGDLIWWRDDLDKDGEFLFSFDRERTFNFFADYPQELTPEQRAIFEKENPELAHLKAT
jgi:hypothetical protein